MKSFLQKKHYFVLCLFTALLTNGFAQHYTWINGSTLTGQTGNYGTIGSSAPTNSPGAREGAMSWKDASGNFWMFGGYGYYFIGNFGYLNDLWKYSTTSNAWTWVSGNNIIAQVGVYGTVNVPSSTNKPGSRSVSVTWQDASGNVYLFGGYGYDATGTLGYLNDLWKYNPTSNQWTWLKGSTQCYQPVNSGTIGISAPSNVPGARFSSVSWTDLNGNLWMFGGFGNTTTSLTVGYLNDLWKYNTATNEWTWMKGNNTGNINGVYGTLATASSSNNPGSRSTSSTWLDASGDLWLFGGDGYGTGTATTGKLNDLWFYNATSNNWTWIKGSGSLDFPGIYGTMGTPALSNIPGARRSSASWIDGSQNLWLFGGFGQPASGAPGQLNDLWRYTNCFISPISMSITSSNTLVCAGESVTLTASGATTFNWSNGGISQSIIVNPTVTTAYLVSTTTTNNCVYSTTYTQSINPCTGLNKQDVRSVVNLYPNPNKGSFIIENEDFTTIELYNNFGQLVAEKNLDVSGKTNLVLNLSPGIYLYHVTGNKNTKAFGKLVIE